MTQNEQILKALKSGRELTPLDALSEFGCFRLAARCHELKMQGNKIVSRKIKSANGKSFCGYRLA